MEARPDRSYRCAHRACNLLHREVAVETEDDGDALIWVEVREGAVEGIAVLDLPMGVMRVSVPSRSIKLLVASDAAASKAVAACVGKDSAEPGIHPVVIAEPMEIPPGSRECVVGRIFCLLCVAEDETCQPIGSVQAQVGETLECGSACRIGIGRDGPRVLRQLGLSFREFPVLHRYRRTSDADHSIFGRS